MKTSSLTGYQRVQRAFTHQPHDRVPRYDTFWPETIPRWQGEGLDGDQVQVLDRLQADIHPVGGGWICPAGETTLLSEDEQICTLRNPWGATVRQWKHKSGTPEHLAFDCDSRAKWEKTYKPALLAYQPNFEADDVIRQYRIGRAASRWCCFTGLEPFEILRAMMGDEVTMIAMATEPDWVRDVSQTCTDVVLRTLEAAWAKGVEPDGVWTYGDMAYNHATMCSPQMYKDLIWPDHKRIVDWTHAHGMKFIYHTDGNVNGVMDLYIEAGFDCLQPLEAKAGMDLGDLVGRYGDQLVFFGNIDIMVLATNDRDRIEQEVIAKLQAGKADRGYIYHSDHSIPPTVTWDTYQFVIDLIDRHGHYD